MRGTIVRVNTDRGFGFIEQFKGADAFFHASRLAPGLEFSGQLLQLAVDYELEETPHRGIQAVNVRPAK